MCGRYTLSSSLSDLQALLPGIDVSAAQEPRFNIAPTQAVPVVPNDGRQALQEFRWGLVPSWAKERSIGSRMINARAETLSEKPSFRTPYRKRRCLVLADGFYEWRKEPDGSKTPTYMSAKEGGPFAFAGLWETWQDPDAGALQTCTIVTTAANELLAPIHHRMPVILPPEAHGRWLDPGERAPSELDDLLAPCPEDLLRHHPVSRAVGNARNQGPELIVPA